MTDWPKHADGTPKKVGEMTREEQRVVFAASAQRIKAELESPKMQRALASLLSDDAAGTA